MSDSIAKSQKIRELFNAEKIDPAASSIVAVAILCERTVAAPPPQMDPMSWDDDPDPGDAAARQAAFLAAKIIPQYQPTYIPAEARFGPGTLCVLREFRPGEQLDSAYINQRLATMLADLLGDRSLDDCSAISLIGNSPALGETRFGLVAAVEASVQFSSTYTKPLFGGIVGTYHEYTATGAVAAQDFLASRKVTEPYVYIEIRTPDGGYGMDLGGTYEFDLDD